MDTKKQIYEKLPARIGSPEELRNHRVEVIFVDLDRQEPRIPNQYRGWPTGYFEETFGSLPDLEERENTVAAEDRDELL